MSKTRFCVKYQFDPHSPFFGWRMRIRDILFVERRKARSHWITLTAIILIIIELTRIMECNFAVVAFTDEDNAPDVISTCWMGSDHTWCWYPNTESKAEKNQLVRDSSQPDISWQHRPIRVQSYFYDFNDAVNHLSGAGYTSNLNTEVENTCLQIKKEVVQEKRSRDESSDENDNSSLTLPLYPAPPRKISKVSPATKRSGFNNQTVAPASPIIVPVSRGGAILKDSLASQKKPLSGTDENHFNNVVNPLSDAGYTSNIDTEVQGTYLLIQKEVVQEKRSRDKSNDETDNSSLTLPSYPAPPQIFSKVSPATKRIEEKNQTVPVILVPVSRGGAILKDSLASQKTPLSATDESTREEMLSLKKVQEELLNRQEDISCSLKRIEAKMDKLIAMQTASSEEAQTSTEKAPNDLELLPVLPLAAEQMNSFEAKLLTSETMRQRLRIILLSCCGKDCKGYVASCLRRTITNEAAVLYSLTGKQKIKTNVVKLPFEKTAIYQIIKEVCFKSYEGVKDNVIRDAVSDWLLQAKFRIARRQGRHANDL